MMEVPQDSSANMKLIFLLIMHTEWKSLGIIQLHLGISVSSPASSEHHEEPVLHTKLKAYLINKLIKTKLNLKNGIIKKETAPDILKSQALEAIHTDYPEHNWLHVFTDDSCSDSHMIAGSESF
ncbi:hypothetical protein CEXT_629421 [Caerostris extrusa]|uniref:Transposase n=1 Tax=Caerostris extrusa TaxID=172846 RepID=A0AAV4TSN3_CAEEX|nr:hypothetical protein CEXT_629421 [Caerostris extrusa]